MPSHKRTKLWWVVFLSSWYIALFRVIFLCTSERGQKLQKISVKYAVLEQYLVNH